jgi:hypothetical protein
VIAACRGDYRRTARLFNGSAEPHGNYRIQPAGSKVGAGFESYDKVTGEDLAALRGAVTTLAEDLSKLP